MNKQEILQSAYSARTDEVFGYQINIDNYQLAIAHIDTLPEQDRADLMEFRAKLSNLLGSETLEQKKARVMLSVIESQLGD